MLKSKRFRSTDRLSRAGLALFAGLAAVMLLWACGDDAANGKRDDSPRTPSTAQRSGADDDAARSAAYTVKRYVRDADQATGLAFDRRGRLIYAEKDSGRIIRVSSGRKRVLANLAVVGGGEAGLLGLAVDRSDRVYAYYTAASRSCPNPTRRASSGSLQGHCIWRFKPARSGKLAADRRIFSSGHPSSAENHVGGGLHFAPGSDDALYVSIGDLGENGNNNGPRRAQDLSLPFGKILRLDPSTHNRAAKGNPGYCHDAAFKHRRATKDRRIWACGLRNTYQFAFDRQQQIWGAEAGDSCDEINRMRAGGNYGWQPPRTDCAGSGPGRPVVKLRGTPSGIAVPTSRSAGSWRDDVFYCVFSGNKLMRYDRSRRRSSEVKRAAGHCSYDLVARGNRLYMSSGDAIYRLTIGR